MPINFNLSEAHTEIINKDMKHSDYLRNFIIKELKMYAINI